MTVELAEIPIYSLNDRPSWSEYFMFLAFSVATRSDDCFIKHGSVIVHDDSHHIVGTGYNNSISGMSYDILNPYDRDIRRPRMKHAEDNAIKNCSDNPKRSSSKYTMYCTGIPCLDCLEDTIQFGISKLVGIDRLSTITNNEEIDTVRAQILKNYAGKFEISLIPMDNQWVQRGLEILQVI